VDDLVRGYDLDNGKTVVVTDKELEALAPKKSREIELRLFVDRDGIDPLYFERCYFLAPGRNGAPRQTCSEGSLRNGASVAR